MELLALVLVVVAIFVGKGKGIALWLTGTIVLIVLGNHQSELLQLYHNHQLPIMLGVMVVPAIAIMISRWWGLAFYIVGTIAATLIFFLLAMATAQIH